MDKEIDKIITKLEGCFGIFDYLLTPVENNVLVSYIKKLQQQCKKQKEVINKAIEYINENLIISSILDGKKYYTISDYSFDYRELLDILNEVTNNE